MRKKIEELARDPWIREKIKALRNFMDQLLDKVGKIEKNELVKKAIERGLDGS